MKLKHVFMIAGLILSAFCITNSKAAGLGDLINTTLTEHVQAESQWTTKGQNKLALMDSVILIGKMEGAPIAQGRFGFTAVANPQGNVERGAGYLADIFINVAPFVRKYVHLADEWTFLNSIGAGPSYGYDFREHHSVLSFSVNLAFGLNPKP